jgi:hypothetical protein
LIGLATKAAKMDVRLQTSTRFRVGIGVATVALGLLLLLTVMPTLIGLGMQAMTRRGNKCMHSRNKENTNSNTVAKP